MEPDKDAPILGKEISEAETIALINTAMLNKRVMAVKVCGHGIGIVFADRSGISFVFTGDGFSITATKMVPIENEGMVQ